MAEAQLALSLSYESGTGVLKDDVQSIRWLREAAKNGHEGAQLLLGFEYAPKGRLAVDLAETVKWLRQSAEAGYPAAQTFYGAFLFEGKGVSKNQLEALDWFKAAATQGDAYGQLWLGFCYAQGLGIEKNFQEAERWLKLAADQNDPEARYRLRLLFFQKHSLLKWRYACVSFLGYGLLIFHAFREPILVNFFAVGWFLATLSLTAIAFVLLLLLVAKFAANGVEREEQEALETNDRLIRGVKRRPWKFLHIPAEDGFFLLPLLYIGINPVSAALAASLFAAAHYPVFAWRYCIPKGIAYFFIALFVLPYGIWSVIVGHLLIDGAVFAAELLTRIEGKPTWRQLLKALRSS